MQDCVHFETLIAYLITLNDLSIWLAHEELIRG